MQSREIKQEAKKEIAQFIKAIGRKLEDLERVGAQTSAVRVEIERRTRSIEKLIESLETETEKAKSKQAQSSEDDKKRTKILIEQMTCKKEENGEIIRDVETARNILKTISSTSKMFAVPEWAKEGGMISPSDIENPDISNKDAAKAGKLRKQLEKFAQSKKNNKGWKI